MTFVCIGEAGKVETVGMKAVAWCYAEIAQVRRGKRCRSHGIRPAAQENADSFITADDIRGHLIEDCLKSANGGLKRRPPHRPHLDGCVLVRPDYRLNVNTLSPAHYPAVLNKSHPLDIRSR